MHIAGHLLLLLGLIGALAALPGCSATDPKPEEQPTRDPSSGPEKPTGSAAGEDPDTLPEYIGEATMEEDGTLILNLRAVEATEDGEGAVGHGQVRYPPDHQAYPEVLEHLGGDMQPGDTRLVPPWPNE